MKYEISRTSLLQISANYPFIHCLEAECQKIIYIYMCVLMYIYASDPQALPVL